jgi:glyoxylase-like metal-dependent hydrolase (beta-lactamase superfamily II)
LVEERILEFVANRIRVASPVSRALAAGALPVEMTSVAIAAGVVRTMTRWLAQSPQVAVFGDRNWTEPLPNNMYLIQHPDGPILFDTGESPHAGDRPGPGPVGCDLPVVLLPAHDPGAAARLAHNIPFQPSPLKKRLR